MSEVKGMGGYSSSSGRWKKSTLSRKGKKALTALVSDHHGEIMMNVHRDSESLRRFGESLKKKKGFPKESRAEFELDQDSGMIFLKIFDAETGELRLMMSPEEVSKCLEDFEGAEDNAAPLSSFFVDVTV